MKALLFNFNTGGINLINLVLGILTLIDRYVRPLEFREEFVMFANI